MIRRPVSFRAALFAGAALFLMPLAAFAQPGAPGGGEAGTTLVEAETAGPATAPAETSEAGGDEAEVGTVEEVIVTATKRETTLQDTPIAITVVGADRLEQNKADSLLDVANLSPSLRVSTFESRQSALTVGIRGIVPNDANQPAREQGVGVYVDGVYLGRQQGLNGAMLDIERIEILRGPQGTLFGRNTEGGALHLITRRPTGVFGYRTTVGVSNYNGYNFDTHIDLPEVAGFSVKLDGALQKHDATLRNPLQGQTGWNYLNQYGYRAAVRYNPGGRLDAIYAYDFGHSETTPFYSQLVSYNPNNLPVSTAFPRPSGTISPLPPGVRMHNGRQEVADIGAPQQPSVDEVFGHSLTLNYDINDNLTLRSISAYREVEVEQYDNAGGPNRPPVFQPNAPEGNSARNFSRYSLSDFAQLQRSQEFQLIGSALGERLEYVIGAYYFNEKAWEEAATPSSLTYTGSSGASVVRDPRVAGIERGFRSIDRASLAKAQSTGLFVHTVYTPPILADALHVTLGGRYTKDDKQGVLYKVANQPRNFTFTLEESRFDPLVTLAYDVTPDINLYATYSTGYRAGGANSRSLVYAPFQSEEVENREFGIKSQWFDGRLTANLAAYFMNRTNSQIDFTLVAPDPVSGTNRNTNETVNAPGTTTLNGLEIETDLKVTSDLRVSLSYAYTDTDVPNAQNPFPPSAACPACGTIQPVYIIYTPRHAATLGVDYRYPIGFADLRVNLTAAYSEGTQSFEQFSQTTDDAFLVNGRVSLADWAVSEGHRLTLSLWSRNLLDNAFIYRRSAENRTGSNAIGDYANYNEPRTYGLELKVKY
jgi:iron complex outermembrane receptor protein